MLLHHALSEERLISVWFSHQHIQYLTLCSFSLRIKLSYFYASAQTVPAPQGSLDVNLTS